MPTASDELRALEEVVPADAVEAAVDWLRWCVCERARLQGIASERVLERACRAELDARAELARAERLRAPRGFPGASRAGKPPRGGSGREATAARKAEGPAPRSVGPPGGCDPARGHGLSCSTRG